jgi:hypothetical protein
MSPEQLVEWKLSKQTEILGESPPLLAQYTTDLTYLDLRLNRGHRGWYSTRQI